LRLPCGVTGPFDLAPLAREASVCLGVLIRDLIMHDGHKKLSPGVWDVVDCKGIACVASVVMEKAWEGFGRKVQEMSAANETSRPMGRLAAMTGHPTKENAWFVGDDVLIWAGLAGRGPIYRCAYIWGGREDSNASRSHTASLWEGARFCRRCGWVCTGAVGIRARCDAGIAAAVRC
jgi:hypothetical protein